MVMIGAIFMIASIGIFGTFAMGSFTNDVNQKGEGVRNVDRG